MELRPPSIAHGVVSFLWALGLGAFLYVGMLAIGIGDPTAFIVAALSGVGIFFLVRVYGEDRPRSGRAR